MRLDRGVKANWCPQGQDKLFPLLFLSCQAETGEKKSLGKAGEGGLKAIFDPMTKLPAFLSIKPELREGIIFHLNTSRTVLVPMLFGFIWQLHS